MVNKKGQLLLVYNTLKKYSDEQHYLTDKQIIDYIKKDYGNTYDRKSIKNSIKILEDFGYDIDIGLHQGRALVERLFSPSEVTYLVDAIFSSHVIPNKDSEKLAKKITSVLSTYYDTDYSYIKKTINISKTLNKEIFGNIIVIKDAIKNKKKIQFYYLTYNQQGKEMYAHENKPYIVSPYYLLNSQGRYYLLCSYKRNRSNELSLITFRVDLMKKVEVLEKEKSDSITKIKKYHNGFDISEYINDHIYPFNDEIMHAKLKLNNPNVIKYVIDWFGKNAIISSKNNEIYVNIKCSEQALFYWCLQYAEHIKVISPLKLIDKIKQVANDTLKKYQ